MRERQERTLERLSECGLTEFYLSGGTALSLRYEHRVSDDLDLFSFPEFSETAFPLERVLRAVQNVGGEVIGTERGTVWAKVDGVKVSFFSYPYPLLAPTSDAVRFPVASDQDVAASKLVSVAQRGEKKDFFDLWFLIRKHGWGLDALFGLCQKKYDLPIDQRALFVRSLVYFEDAERQDVLLSDGNPPDAPSVRPLSEQEWNEIKTFFRDVVKRFCSPSAKRPHHPTVSDFQP